ncbi:MAG: helix-turn-helix domain-containing protein [Myxococcota bacterium]
MGRDADANARARAQTRSQLLDAALELFAERGFSGTSMAALASRAGVSKGLAYHYFPSKQALVEAVVQQRIEVVASAMAALPDHGSPADRLLAAGTALLEAGQGKSNTFHLYLRALTDPALRHAMTDVATRVDRTAFEAFFVELGAEDPALEARFFQVGMLGILTHLATSPVPVDGKRLVQRLVHAIVERT